MDQHPSENNFDSKSNSWIPKGISLVSLGVIFQNSCKLISHIDIASLWCLQIQWRALDEINSGVCDGMTYEEIKKTMPEEFEYV